MFADDSGWPLNEPFPYEIPEECSYEDASITTQLRILDGEASAGVYGRSTDSRVYFGIINYEGGLSLGESDEFGAVLDVNRLQTTLDPMTNDVLLKMDFDGELMSLTAWLPGETMPSEPQLTYNDGTLSSGTVALLGSGTGEIAFRSFEVAPLVPEPSGRLLAGVALTCLLAVRSTRFTRRGSHA